MRTIINNEDHSNDDDSGDMIMIIKSTMAKW